MQENGLWGSSLFFNQFSGSQDRQRNAEYPLPSRLIRPGECWAFLSWTMSISQTLLSCKPNILWCEWSSRLQCSYWRHRFRIHEVVILPFGTEKQCFLLFICSFQPQTMIIACMLFKARALNSESMRLHRHHVCYCFLHSYSDRSSSELWGWQSCW